MADGRRRNGGAREKAGRKSKAEVMGLPYLIEDCIGDRGKRNLVKQIYAQAQDGSFAHQQLLMHYIFGKPPDKVDITNHVLEVITGHEIIEKKKK